MLMSYIVKGGAGYDGAASAVATFHVFGDRIDRLVAFSVEAVERRPSRGSGGDSGGVGRAER